MPESTLSLTYNELRAEVGTFLGYGSDVTLWAQDDSLSAAANAQRQKKRELVESCVRSGLRRFYSPGNYEWSFLRPTTQINIPSGSVDVRLPLNFGGLDGPMYYHGDESRAGAGITIVGEGEIRKKRQDAPDTTGTPQIACIRPTLATAPTHGQRWDLCVWPTPDAEYTVVYRYFVLADALSEEQPYPLGGQEHAETILTSCLAVAEERRDNVQGGPQMQAFATMLANSMAADRKRKPSNLGRYGHKDGSTEYDQRADVIVTHNNVQY
jgi:hypothetical protein